MSSEKGGEGVFYKMNGSLISRTDLFGQLQNFWKAFMVATKSTNSNNFSYQVGNKIEIDLQIIHTFDDLKRQHGFKISLVDA